MRKKNLKEITKNSIIHIVFLFFIAIAILFYYNKFISYIFLVLLLFIIMFNWFGNFKREKKVLNYIENISLQLSEINDDIITKLEVPILITEENGDIVWYNSYMSDIAERELFNQNIENIIVGCDLKKIENNPQSKEIVKISDRFYNIKLFDCSDKKTILDLDNKRLKYFILLFDITDYKKITELYNDKKLSVIYLQIDNYEDIISELKDDKRIILISEIEKKIMLFATRVNAVVSKYEKDKYLIVLENRHLLNIITNKFTILEDIKEVENMSVIPTISIGASSVGSSPAKIQENAFSALEMALGRGGDQAVVKLDNDYEFYGGRSKGIEKTNKVKSRIIAHAFRNILDETAKVYIMGHQYPDMDAIGASIGVYRICLNMGKDAKIVLNESNESIKLIYDKFKDDPNYKFIKHDEALEEFNVEKDLLVVVDTHKPSLTECPKMVEIAEKIVLFDHHRRSKEYIEKTLLTYLEPYASSTCELISEVIQYIQDEIILEKKEAEALLAGIILDTKNFSQQVGVRTFQAAAFLRKYDADTFDVRQLFQDDLQTYINKADFVKNAKVYDSHLAISVNPKPISNPRLIISQAADQLLNIIGINCAFVIACDENYIYISGRSVGEISVQIILENIGGGGHLNASAAQFSREDFEIDNVEKLLRDSIDSYFLDK